MSVRQQVKNGAPFNADRDLRMDIVFARGLRDASASDFTNKHTHRRHLRGPPTTKLGFTCVSEALTKMDQLFPEARKRNHYARPGHVSFDERSHKLFTIAMESFGRLGRKGSEFINQLATSDRRKGLGGHGQERHLQGTHSTDNLNGLSGRNLTSSSPVQARIPGPPSDKR